jgi:hypothetical protein
MIAIESQHREPWPRWRVMAFMSSLSLAAGFSARLYVDQLEACLNVGLWGQESEDD